MTPYIHPRIQLWLELGDLLLDAAEASAKHAKKLLQPRRRGSYKTRRPGLDSPMWNICATLLREELRPFGSQARLARYLGIPRQRLHDFLTGRKRLPDAELTLQLLAWLSHKRAGRDISV